MFVAPEFPVYGPPLLDMVSHTHIIMHCPHKAYYLFLPEVLEHLGVPWEPLHEPTCYVQHKTV